jgi:thiosulfate reductase cytochrome b subunit
MSDATLTQGNAGDTVRTALGLRPRGPSYLFYRHSIPVRVLHWMNALCMLVMIMSGLQIFNAHPSLYWGKSSTFDHPILSLTAFGTNENFKGATIVGPWRFDTDGVLGASSYQGTREVRGFPSWVTLPADSPNLALGRLWHFAFAWLLVFNGACYFAWSFASGHFRKDLLPTGKDISNLPHEIVTHAKLQFPKGEEAKHYNALQKLTYFTVAFVLGPLIVLTGLTMSPMMDSAFPFLLWIFDGRQSARTIHFIVAFSFVAFFIVHIIMVILSGTWNNLRSMITGRYAIVGKKTDV